MFERFTERARAVLVLAQEEARTLKQNYIGTEHILLGLIREDEGVAAHALASLGVVLEDARARVVAVVGTGEDDTSDQIPFTPRAKKVLELAMREALHLGHNHIGTEHMLLGLVREREGVGGRVLAELGADPERVRGAVRDLLEGRPATIDTPARPDAAFAAWLGRALIAAAAAAPPEPGRPDGGDLLLALAREHDSVVARTLAQLGVDDARLRDAIERARQ